MSAKKIKNIVWLFLLGGIMTGCVASIGPHGWLPHPKDALCDTYGAWLAVEYTSVGGVSVAEGEFIALDSASVYILNESGMGIIPIIKIQKATLAAYRESGMIGIWALLGTISSASHGYFAGISLPIWLVAGISNASAESSSGIVKSSFINGAEFTKYARFPQGLPEGIDLDTLQPKKKQ